MGQSNETINALLDTFFEIEPLDTDSFLKVKETLTRIGLPGKKTDGRPVLWQTAHVLQKRGHYYICHFKQLFQLDGRKETNYTDEDDMRLEFIVCLLEEWGLIHSMYDVEKPHINVMVIPYSDKSQWDLKTKYTLGADKVRFKHEHKWRNHEQEVRKDRVA